MSKKVTMLEVWFYPYPDVQSLVPFTIYKTLIKPEEFDDFRKSVYSVLKVKRMKVKIN